MAACINATTCWVTASVSVFVNGAVFESNRSGPRNSDSRAINRLIPPNFTLAEKWRSFIDSYATVDGVFHDAVYQFAIRCTAIEVKPLPLRRCVSRRKDDLSVFCADRS